LLLIPALPPPVVLAVEFTPLATITRGLNYPTDVAVSNSGTIYVADGVAKQVFIYNSGYVLTGSLHGLENPTAVAVSGNTVFIADNGTKTVKRYSETGTSAGELKRGGLTAVFKLPRNIAIDASGNVYVVDQFAGTIEVFNGAGSYLYSITGLSKPQDAAVVGNTLYIIDQSAQNVTVKDESGNNVSSELRVSRLQVFDLGTRSFVDIDVDGNNDGQVDPDKKLFSNYGTDTSTGQYINLKGIATDNGKNIYLNDAFLNVIYKYDSSGSFVGVIDVPVLTPLGATVSTDGRLFAVSSYEGAVKVIGIDAVAGAGTWLKAPVADAGPDQTVREGATIILDGSDSAAGNVINAYQWTQKSGTNILPANPYVTDSPRLTLTAPHVGPDGDVLVFELTVVDVYGLASQPSTTTVTVNNAVSGSLVINDGAHYTSDPIVSLTLVAPEAVAMRFANDDEPFNTIFYRFMPEIQWTLSDGDGIKYVRVELKDAGGNTTVVTNIIILDTEVPGAPVIIDDGSGQGEFDWEPVAGAVSYTLQYAFNGDFTVGVVTLAGLTYNGATIALDGLAAGTWYWRVRAVDEAGNAGDWSQVNTFEIAPDCATAVPEPPILSSPCNLYDVSRTPLLETGGMTYLCGDHQRTTWQVSQNDDFSSLVMDVHTTLENLTSYRIPALVLDPDSTYFWRVVQEADNGKQSAWSEPCIFTTEDWPDIEGEEGVLYVRPDEDPEIGTDEIAIRESIGDSAIKIKVVRVIAGVIAKTIKELDPDSVSDTYSAERPEDFPLGLLSFRLEVEPGAWAQVEITFSGPVPQDAQWYIYTAEEGWHTYAGAVFSRNRRSVLLNFQDGGYGDTDGVVNGIIVNP